MKQLLKDLVASSSCYVEARFHKRTANAFTAHKGRVDVANHSVNAGVGIRVLVNGNWGFAATTRLTKDGLERALNEAIANAQSIATIGRKSGIRLASGALATEDFIGPDFAELLNMPLADKLGQIVEFENQLAGATSKLHSASCRYREIFEEKIIVTSDGAAASIKLAQPEVSFSAIAEDHGQQTSAGQGAGVLGGWQCLYNHPALENVIEDTAKLAVDLLRAKHPDGGYKTCILAPAVVGLLCHEAVGHTVEADFVKSGSIAKGKLNKKIASPLVNMADSGQETISGYAVGNIPFDDEGVKTETTTIIENGILKSYLHNKETAAEFGVKPTGNARAWMYDDEPLIRMRNTYFLPGDRNVEDMIAELDDGYLVEGAGSGQADSNGEFMFGSSHVWRIKGGKKTELLREATLSGIAFDVLNTVDAVSKEFRWDSGTGYCGKGQPAKVDAGGPYIRCKINIGGRQS